MHLRLTRPRLHLFLILALALPLAAIYAAPWWSLQAAPESQPREARATQPAPFVYVPATGHNIGLAIKRFYEANGGLSIFGLPLTELIEQDGMQVQYFERARFELHPELPAPYYVSLTLVGSLLTRDRAESAFAPVEVHSSGNGTRTNPLPPTGAQRWRSADERGYQPFVRSCPRSLAFHIENCGELLMPQPTAEPEPRTFFPITGHTLGGVFGDFWMRNGQVPVFGYPISEEFHEVNALDGKVYLVQYFERARFEYHPEHAGTPYQVLLGQLGEEYARARGLAAELRAPSQPITLLGRATLAYAPGSATGKNMRLAAARLDGRTVAPGQALSYNQALGEVSARAGYLAAPAIVDGRIGDDIGGGICRVSTLLYRAAFAAGLPIEERHSHSRMLAYLRDQPGMDAAVYLPNLDLRWRNDMPGPITIVAGAGADGRMTVALWGIGDGRTTSVARPKVLKHAFTTDQPDAQPTTYIQPAMDVATGRVVRDASGKVIRSERIHTHYEPLERTEE
jgi:hypothetical protein